MGQFIVKYARLNGEPYELRLRFQLPRDKSRAVRGLRVIEVELDGQVFKPKGRGKGVRQT